MNTKKQLELSNLFISILFYILQLKNNFWIYENKTQLFLISIFAIYFYFKLINLFFRFVNKTYYKNKKECSR